MSPEHNEPCKGLQCVIERVARLEEKEQRTHDWVKDIDTRLDEKIDKLVDEIHSLRITVARYVGWGLGAVTVISSLVNLLTKVIQ